MTNCNETQSESQTNCYSALPICFKNTEELIEAMTDILISSGKSEEEFSKEMNREVLVYFPFPLIKRNLP